MADATGSYWGMMTEFGAVESKKGTPGMAITWSVTHRSDGEGNWAEMEPIRRTTCIWFSDESFDNGVKKLKAIGWNEDFENPAFDPEHEACTGTELVCRYQKDSNQFTEWVPALWDALFGGKGLNLTPAPVDVLRKLNARMKNKAGAPPPAGRPGPGPRPAAPAAARPAQPQPRPAGPQQAPAAEPQEEGGLPWENQ